MDQQAAQEAANAVLIQELRSGSADKLQVRLSLTRTLEPWNMTLGGIRAAADNARPFAVLEASSPLRLSRHVCAASSEP